MAEVTENEPASASERESTRTNFATDQPPPLPAEAIPSDPTPSLPAEPVPESVEQPAEHENARETAVELPEQQADEEDDGWVTMWDHYTRRWYFYNDKTGVSQWENPRVPEATEPAEGQVQPAYPTQSTTETTSIKPASLGGYDPRIHGSYDPNADYAKEDKVTLQQTNAAERTQAMIPNYSVSGAFNRYTGQYQNAQLGPENYNDDAKANRQQNSFYDVHAAANDHDGRSLKEERRQKRYSRQEIQAFKDKRKARKEQKRRAWLLD